jgi:hypothetical protein
MNKLLWQQFADMTAEQVTAEHAEELARLKAGTMTGAEARERADAWRQAAEWQLKQAEALETEHKRRRIKKLGLRVV